jgi:hypothetical protein
MHTVTSFHSSDIQPDQLNAIMADYTALERVRIYRRLFVTRFGLLALAFVVVGAGLGVLPAFATWFSVGLRLAPPVAVCLAEFRYSRRLARRLAEIPRGVTHVAAMPGVRKS